MSIDFLKKSCLVFDAYGTLFNVDTSLDELSLLSADMKKMLIDTWRAKQLQYTWLRSLMNRYCSFQQVTEEALAYALEQHQIDYSEQIFDSFMRIYLEPELMQGARELLEFLKVKNVTSAILSNGTMHMLERGVMKCGIEELIGTLMSVEAISEFKPSPAVYRMAQDQLESDKTKILFISGNPWDISGASNFGLDCVWINAGGKVRDKLPYGEVAEYESLGVLLQKLAQALS